MRGSEAQGSSSYLPLAAADIDAMPNATSQRRSAGSPPSRRWPLPITFLLWLAAALLTLLVARSYDALSSTLNIHQACRMSRMYPSYVLHHPPSPSGLGNKYSLYLYREDNPLAPDEPPTQRRRPAVFLPGNAGSYGQIRSLASWARHDFEERRARGSGGAEANVWETDWWTLDFNEVGTRQRVRSPLSRVSSSSSSLCIATRISPPFTPPLLNHKLNTSTKPSPTWLLTTKTSTWTRYPSLHTPWAALSPV